MPLLQFKTCRSRQLKPPLASVRASRAAGTRGCKVEGAKGGLNFGTVGSSAILGATLVLFVVWSTIEEKRGRAAWLLT
jgi:hypothetical protein